MFIPGPRREIGRPHPSAAAPATRSAPSGCPASGSSDAMPQEEASPPRGEAGSAQLRDAANWSSRGFREGFGTGNHRK